MFKSEQPIAAYAQCIASAEENLANFAQSLGEDFLICDLRNPRVGDGFSWGRYGPQTVLKRYGDSQIFAYQVRPSLWQRLFKNR